MKLLDRLFAMLRRSDQRERVAHERYRASLQKAVQVMPGDEKLRQLLHEADEMLRGYPR